MAQAAPKRDATWDIARGIGMMLVIYGHLLEPMYPAHGGRALVEPPRINGRSSTRST